jgi:hypothetical protein
VCFGEHLHTLFLFSLLSSLFSHFLCSSVFSCLDSASHVCFLAGFVTFLLASLSLRCMCVVSVCVCVCVSLSICLCLSMTICVFFDSVHRVERIVLTTEQKHSVPTCKLSPNLKRLSIGRFLEKLAIAHSNVALSVPPLYVCVYVCVCVCVCVYHRLPRLCPPARLDSNYVSQPFTSTSAAVVFSPVSASLVCTTP